MLEVGKLYQSRNLPHIKRKVQRVHNGVVTYSIFDDREPDAMWRTMTTAIESEFIKCTVFEGTTNEHA